MTKYRKIPVVIEAIQFQDEAESLEQISEFAGSVLKVSYKNKHLIPHLEIETATGVLRALPGDYIIREINGELSSCRENKFRQIYEKVREWSEWATIRGLT